MDSKEKKLLLIILGAMVICGVLLFLIWQNERQNQFLEVVFFDIGQGDSILIKTPSHHSILIDGGPDATVLSKLGRNLPFYDHSIDLMLLTHAHSDHVAGLVDVLKRYDVKKVLYTGVEHSSPDFIAWEDLIEQKNIEMVMPVAGLVYQFGEVDLEILFPLEDISEKEFKDLNDSSIVTRLEYQDTSFLLTGDAPVGIEEDLLQAQNINLKGDVLKVGHHGSKYSSSLEFLQAVDPKFAVIQSGEGNKFGHPHKLTLNKLNGLGIQILRNDEMGDISFGSDGLDIWLNN